MNPQHLSMGAFPKQLEVLQVLIDRPEMLKHEFRITSVYGSFPNVIWNGGRHTLHLINPLDTSIREYLVTKNREWYDPLGMESLVRAYNDRNIGIRYTFSNPLITKEHLNDARANLTLEIAHNPLNAVITSNPIIEEYVRKKYPKFKIICSATANNLSLPFLKRRIEEVDLLVIPPEYNKHLELIQELGASKIEVIINERCVPFCPSRMRHYEAESQTQLTLDTSYQEYVYHSSCPAIKAAESGKEPPDMVMDDQLIGTLQKIGVEHFKFVGRQMTIQEFIVEVDKLLIKEEFRMENQE
jgi:collagenase-like PrtC family protease